MTLASPWALWWLGLFVPVVALFFFRVRPTEFIVPALALWEKLSRAREVHGFGTRFGRWPTLLVQLAIILLLVLALSDPRQGATQRVIIVLDDSATMQTIDASGRTRFELAKAAALERIRASGVDGVAAVVLAGDPARVAAFRETNQTALEANVGALASRDVNADMSRAIRLAAKIGAETGAAGIVIFSDKLDMAESSALPVTWKRIGQPARNVGVAGIRKSGDGKGLIASLHQEGFDGGRGAVRLVVDGREIDRKELSFKSPKTEVALAAPMGDGQSFEVRCEPDDSLPLDNVFNGVWKAPAPAHILLVTKGNLPLSAALSQPELKVETILPEQWIPSRMADVVVLDAPEMSDARIDAGRFIVFGGKDPFGLTSTIAPATDQRPAQWSPDSPILKDVDLLNWQVRRTAQLGPAAAQPIVSGADAPLVLAGRRAANSESQDDQSISAVLVNFDLRDSNVTTRASFPIFVWNAVQSLLGRHDERTALALPTGGPARIPGRFPADVRVTDPRGHSCEVLREKDAIVLLQPDRAGLYHAESGTNKSAVALNWTSESPEIDVDVRAGASPASTGSDMFRSWWQPLWSRVLLLAAGVILIEMILFHLNILRMG